MLKGAGAIMQPIDKEIRDMIILQEGNIVISASAGMGKTHTTIAKIRHDVEENKSFRTFAAITFTKKAAKEIETRLSGAKVDGFVGTNDTFVLQEIIRPFMYDVYGREFKKDIKSDYSTENQIRDFDEGIKKIDSKGFICKYADNKKNYSFQLSLRILQGSEAARLYFKSKYYRVYIDEYQDCDKDMHELFMYICRELHIPLFVVGDLKQSIYGWRGGYDKGFQDLLSDCKFNAFELKHNFRSVIGIQNYANMFVDNVRTDFRLDTFDDSVHCFAYKSKTYAIEKVREWVNIKDNCAFLIRNRDDGKRWAKDLKDNDIDFTFIPSSPLDNAEMESEHIWISRYLAFFLISDLYSEYDFYEEIPNADAYNFSAIKKVLYGIKKVLDDATEFEVHCIKMYEILGYELNSKISAEVKLLYQVACNEEYEPTYNTSKYKHVITTIHSAKGLQYAQVIALAENYDLSKHEECNLHYVAVSRPEKRLLVLCNYLNARGKAYCSEIISNVEKVKELGFNVELSDIANCINSDEYTRE